MAATSSFRSLELTDVDTTLTGNSPGYWGAPSATIDWCERNYQVSPYIAEFWNTLSNLLFVVLGTYGLARAIDGGFEWRYRLVYVSTIVVGLGSAMFHGTLQLVSQQLDETPMIWAILVWIFIVFDDELRRLPCTQPTVILGFTLIGVGFAVLHAVYRFTLVFQLLFATLAFACLGRIVTLYRRSTDKHARLVCLTAM